MKGKTEEQTAYKKFSVHMRVRIVDMDQKELVILHQKGSAAKA